MIMKYSLPQFVQPSAASSRFYFFGALFINCSLQLQGDYLSSAIDDSSFVWEKALWKEVQIPGDPFHNLHSCSGSLMEPSSLDLWGWTVLWTLYKRYNLISAFPHFAYLSSAFCNYVS